MGALARDRFERQSGLVPTDRLQSTWATVIGCGSIGRQLALQLTALGVPKLQLIDFDDVGRTNITSQGFLTDDIGRPKVEAVGDSCHQLEHQLDLETIRDRYRPTYQIAPIAFCAVDSITARATIWRSVQQRCEFWGDGRMLGETLRVLVADDEPARRYYAQTLFPQREAQVGACTSHATIYAANLAAALLVHQFTRHLRGLALDVDATFNLLAGEYVVAPVTE